ncbi:MAG: Crp/Fnr family transcriptional regulator [Desulfobacula sp.]|nr:Crp/Fnr family transcriptional regulator [Desulfobacula sp.]MDA8135176.1 Crp/Fnr family transcriptional regulator [Desulfobacteraceae bacterium]
MVEKEYLKKINFLKDLPDRILEKIGAVSQLETFDEETVLFRQDQQKSLLYMLISGKVFLNSRSGSGKSLTLDEVTPGRTFGVSVLLGGEHTSSFTAVCAETSTMITVSGEQMRQLFLEDFEIGHAVMLKMVALFRSRMEMHTGRFLNSLANHPEIKEA